MPIAYFPNYIFADVIEVWFFAKKGGKQSLRLLVDSGSIGESSFIVSNEILDLVHVPAVDSQLSGGLQGLQSRVMVPCEIPALSFQAITFAIVTDTSAFSLPPGVHGFVGLRFLRNFRRWGAEKTVTGDWQFFLET